MKKKYLTLSILIITSLQANTNINTKKIIHDDKITKPNFFKNKNSALIKDYLNSDDMNDNFEKTAKLLTCIIKVNPKAKNHFRDELNTDEMKSRIIKFNKTIKTKELKSLQNDIKNKKMDSKLFKLTLSKMHNIYIAKKVDKDIIDLMFNGEVKKASNIEEYKKAIIINTSINNFLIPLSKKYNYETNYCLSKLNKIEK
jgi:hypothetical protein